MQSFTGQYLLDQKAIWEKEVSFHKVQLNQSWFKVVIHGVPIDVDLSNIPSEISLYNDGLQVIGNPYWLTSAEKRQVQKAESIVVAFATEKEASFCIRNKVYIAGISARVEKMYSTSVNAQCRQCQGFGHLESRCRNAPKCQLCGENHPTLRMDVIAVQEPWILGSSQNPRDFTGSNRRSISHRSFTQILPEGDIRPRVMLYAARDMQAQINTSPSFPTDPDCLLLSIRTRGFGFQLLNIYEEASLRDGLARTIPRVVLPFQVQSKTIVLGDFNTHHPLWDP
ncbi:hypothetical protein K402DRAFT_339679, partial [Aulographum hederae CBS 113979]